MNAAKKKIDINDDILTEILLRLSPKSIFRFITVSKRWSHIINDPFFLRSYSKLHRSSGDGLPLALFGIEPMSCGDLFDSLEMDFVPIRSISQPNMRKEHVLETRFGLFVNSSNGLVLCIVHLVESDEVYNVFNPVTRKSVSLPPPPTRQRYKPYSFMNDGSMCDGLMCEENTDALTPNYIVVRVCGVHRNAMRIETYSSKTGEWAPSTLVATSNGGEPLSQPVVVNGVFHWFIADYNLAVYDPNRNKNHLQLIDAPYTGPGNIRSVVVTRSPDDILWYGLILQTCLKFWMLEKGGDDDDGSYKRDTTIGRDEWILMHNISLEALCGGVVSNWYREHLFSEFILYDVGVVSDGVVSRDPLVLLLKNMQSWYPFNFETKTLHLVTYQGRLLSGDCYSKTLRPFLEYSCLSSYAL